MRPRYAALVMFLGLVACQQILGITEGTPRGDGGAPTSSTGGSPTGAGGVGGGTGGSGGEGGGSCSPGELASEHFFRGSTATINAIAGAPDGGVVVVGEFIGTVTFASKIEQAAQDTDGFIVSFGPDDQPKWFEWFTGPLVEKVNDVAVDAAGDIYVVGEYNGDLAVDSETSSASGVDLEGFLVKFTEGGDLVWFKELDGDGGGDTDDVIAKTVAVTTDYVWVTGHYADRFSVDGNFIDATTGAEMFVSTFLKSGMYVDLVAHGGTVTNQGTAVTPGPGLDTNAVWIGGTFTGMFQSSSADATDGFVGSLQVPGQTLLDSFEVLDGPVANSDIDEVVGVGAAIDDTFRVLGNYASQNFFIQAFDAIGERNWSVHLSTAAIALTGAVSPDGVSVIGGSTIEPFPDFGGGPITDDAGNFEGWVASYNATGEYRYAAMVSADG